MDFAQILQPRKVLGDWMGDTVTFETAMEKLETIVKRLESDAVSLEESLALFEEGVHLGRLCSRKLDEVDRKIQILLENPDGTVQAEPMEAPGE